MRQLNTLIFLAALSALISCRSTKYTPENFPKEQLHFGSGGGFTGQTTTVVLLKNGQIFQQNLTGGAFSELPKIKKKEAKAFHTAANDLDLGAMKFNHPGNIYQFLELKKDSSAARAVWGDENFPPNQKVKDLFIALNGLVKPEIKR